MKLYSGFSLTVWLTLVLVANSRDAGQRTDLQVDRPEEREIITRVKLDEYMATKDSNTGAIMDLAKSTLGGIGTIAAIDYTQSGGQILWEITQAVVPIIGAALALIPGIGVIVSGVFLGVWALISPLFTPQKDNPMEKMIKELADKMNKRMDEKLKNLINLAIYGEIARNSYICNKYAFISHNFYNHFKTNTTLKKSDATNVMLYLNDCDNFLKDTAEAFVYKEYADVLWVPGAITTSARLGFLAEQIKMGHLLKMNRNVTVMYFQELKKDVERQFAYHHEGYKIINKVLEDKNERYDDSKNYLKGISDVETAACSLQSQLFYFDRERYPYGVPTILNNTDNLATINMQDHFRSSDRNQYKHIQIFFNVTKAKYPGDIPKRGLDQYAPYKTLHFQNCLLGPLYLIAPSTFWFNFKPMPVKNKYSYEFRVMYFQPRQDKENEYERSVPVLRTLEKNEWDQTYLDYEALHKKINNNKPVGDRTCLNINFIYPSLDQKLANESRKVIDMPGWARWKTCPYFNVPLEDWRCYKYINMFQGVFRMYSAGTFNHRNEDLNPLIPIDEPIEKVSDGGWPQGFLVGLEIIVRPLIS